MSALPEPQGRYAVILDADGVEWLRSRNGFWCYSLETADSGLSGLHRWRVSRYEDISAVRVLSEGVTE